MKAVSFFQENYNYLVDLITILSKKILYLKQGHINMLAVKTRHHEKYIFFPILREKKKKNNKHNITENIKHHNQLKNNINSRVVN